MHLTDRWSRSSLDYTSRASLPVQHPKCMLHPLLHAKNRVFDSANAVDATLHHTLQHILTKPARPVISFPT